MMKLDNPFTKTGDKLVFSKVLDRYSSHCRNGNDEFTDFLDPNSMGLFANALKKHHVTPVIFGGYAIAERKLASLSIAKKYS